MTSGDGYALDLASPVSHVAAKLDGAAPAALSLAELAVGYRHPNPGDLARVREHEGAATDDEAVEWLIARAVGELRHRTSPKSKEQIECTDGAYRLADGLTLADLQWKGKRVYAVRNAHAQFRDPFNPMSGHFSENIRLGPDRDDLSELRESMRAFGWIPQLRAIRDKRTGVVLAGHRRIKVAAELGLEPVYEDVPLGDGDEADAQRLAIAIASNIGSKPLTPENRKRIAEYLYGEPKWSQERIAEALKVSQRTISTDLEATSNSTKRGRPRGSARPRHPKTPEIREAVRPFVEADRPVPQKQLTEDYGVDPGVVERITAEERIRFETQQETAAALTTAGEPGEQCNCCPHDCRGQGGS